ncbi:hypothetical protein [Zobellia nedashkovskayae]|uniref:hypothetical protein n=1 Tax=Zobellia nedashkovskayae TaxID=2779510 RepID=UPI00188C62DF|nr:hypothetical protein [Zobellia nedashkovskayae]
MKKCFKFSLVAFLLALIMALTSCQDEEPFVETIDEEQTLSFDSTALELMKETVSNDGSYDNIVDGASCFDIQFPYSVVVNDVELTIDSMDGLQVLEEILDDVEGFESTMDIVFPITVTMADYTEVTINSEEDLQKTALECVEGGIDADIECIDVVYPATVFTYNPNFQQTASVLVEHDAELRRFFAGLEETDLVSFDFPLTLKYTDSTEVVANTNTELADILSQAKEACDEDDDNDYNDDDFTQEQLDSVLVQCPWELVQVQMQSADQSAQYDTYAFSFEEGGKVTSYGKNGYNTEGAWSTAIEDYRVVLKLDFEAADQFNYTWKVYEIKEGKIKMFVEDNFLVLEKDCDYEPLICNAETIENRLSVCNWRITDEKGEFFEDLLIDFAEKQMLVYDTNEKVVDEGSWEVEGNILTFTGLSRNLANYIGDWQVLECGEEEMKIQRYEEVVVLTKVCN